MAAFTCTLPGGYIDGAGMLHREAEIVPLTGREEDFLADRTHEPNAALVTHVLSRCVQRIGSISPVSEMLARELLVGDRQYFMLKLREATLGEQVMATVVCPWPDCGKHIDIDFSLGDIPVRESLDKGLAYSVQLPSDATLSDEAGSPRRGKVVFRLPNGADQEIAAALALQDEERALMLLLSRCIKSIDDRANLDVATVEALHPRFRAEIDRAMEAVAPGVESNLHGLCPACGREFTQPFDLQDFFFDELRIRRDLLYRDVHYLAYHYHWSEREIMGLTRTKRRMYIEILADEIERLNNAVQ